MHREALTYLQADLSVIPTVIATKAPAPVIGKWARFQKERPTEAEVQKWFGNGLNHAMAIVCGAVSGYLECLDFDFKGELYGAFMAALRDERPDLMRRLVIQRTQNLGYHIWYRCAGPVAGNMKLAERGIEVPGPGEHEYMGKKHAARKVGGRWFITVCLIETRGEGGYALCAPSPGYTLIQGDFSALPVISVAERGHLIDLSKALNEWVPPPSREAQRTIQLPGGGDAEDGVPPWEAYNAKTNPLQLLTEAGWTETTHRGSTPRGGETVLVRRPGKRHGHSGSVVEGQIFQCWSSNAPPFEPQQAYSAYQVYALLHHQGDFSAAAKQLLKDGYGTPPKKKKRAAAAAGGDVEQSSALEDLNRTHAVIMVGGKCLVLNEITDPVFGRPDITLSTVPDFKNYYANCRVMIENEKGESRSVSVAKLWLESPKRRQYRGIVFSPCGDVPEHYNLFRGLAVTPRQGDWSRLRDHIAENICGGDETHYTWLMSWFAHLVQQPGGGKPGTSIVLRGVQGVGKGCLMAAFGPILGNHYVHVTSQSQIAGRFNQHLKDALLLFADECFWAGDKAAESILKGMITNDYTMVEPKGKDPFPVMSHLRVVIASNEDWVVPAGIEERRFFVLDVGEKGKQDTAYFGKIFAEMAGGGREAFLYELMNWDWNQVDLRTAPRTSGLLDQILSSMGSVEKFWFECLWRGAQTSEAGEWTEYVITDELYANYVRFCEQIGVRYKAQPVSFAKKLRGLCPIVVRSRVQGRQYGTREWALFFDGLEACRDHFEKLVRVAIPWGESSV